MSCTEIPKEYQDFLESVPTKWREQILAFLIKIKQEATSINCGNVKDWETTTSLSPFTIEGTSVCITFTDEKGVETKRCFDASSILSDALYNVDPKCIATQESWRNMTFAQKMQAIIDKICSIPV
jgi:hypothetical protein